MKNYSLLSTAILFSLALSGCNSSSDKNDQKKDVIDPVSPEVAVWHAPAYGFIADIKEEAVQFYQISENFCQKYQLGIDRASFLESSLLSADNLSLTSSVGYLKTPGLVMEKQEQLPDVCQTNLLKNASEEGYEFNAQQELDIFWQSFNELYAFFNIESVDWDAVYQLANNAIDNDTTEEELLEVLTEMVAPLKDFHVSIENEALDVEFSVTRKLEYDDIALNEFLEENQLSLPLDNEQFSDFEQYFEAAYEKFGDIIVSHMANPSEIKTNDTETIAWAKTTDNFGYVFIETMDFTELGGSDSYQLNKQSVNSTLDEVFTDFKELSGIIFDVRINPGGDDEVGQMIVTRLIDKEQHVYSKQARLGEGRTPIQELYIDAHPTLNFTGPIAMLVSSTTSSAAETFSLAMNSRENTIFIGESTGGGLSDTLPRSLPSGTKYTLSNEFYISVDGDEYEGVGIPVDIKQPFFRKEQRDLERDFGLEEAIEWLKVQ